MRAPPPVTRPERASLIGFAAASIGLHALILFGLLQSPLTTPSGSVQLVGDVIVLTDASAEPSEDAGSAPDQPVTPAPVGPAADPPASVAAEIAPAETPVETRMAASPDVAISPSIVPPRTTAPRGGSATTVPPTPRQAPVATAHPDTPSPQAGSSPIDPGWHAATMAWLHRNKVYPPEARARGEEGTGQVRFTVGRDGAVLSVTMVEGTGHPRLDTALHHLLIDARLPAFPPAMTQDRVSLRVRISYGLGP